MPVARLIHERPDPAPDPAIVIPGAAARGRARAAGEFVATAALVGILAALSLRYWRFNGPIPAFWPANAVPLAILLIRRPARWWRLWLVVAAGWLGTISAALLVGVPPARGLGLASANSLEVAVAIVIAWLPLGPRPRIRRLDGLLRFIASVGLFGPAAGAAAACLVLSITEAHPVVPILQTWFAAHAMGDLVFTTAAIALFNHDRRPLIPPGKRLQAGLALAISFILLILTFQHHQVTPLLMAPALFAFLGMIAGFEFACVAVTLLALYALIRTAGGHGPMVALDPGSLTARIILLQGFMFAAFIAAMPIALMFERRGRLIAQLRNQKAAVVSSAARYKELAEVSADTILVTLQDGTILYASPAAERLIGIAGNALKGRSAFDLMHPDDIGSVRTVLATLGGQRREVTAELRLRHETTATPVWTEIKTRIGERLPNRTVELVSVVRDISSRRAEEDRRNADLKRLDLLANTDPLTGLANRRRFNDHLDSEWRRALREKGDIALILLDVDLFKPYNDRYGHPAGDTALRRIAAIVGSGALRSGDLATRIGGEEFAVILPTTFLSGARAVAERIQAGIRDIGIAHEAAQGGFLTVSIGIGCVRPDPSTTPQAFIERVDRALYQAKTTRGSIVIAP